MAPTTGQPARTGPGHAKTGSGSKDQLEATATPAPVRVRASRSPWPPPLRARSGRAQTHLRDVTRACGVNLGSQERVFLIAGWGQGVNLTAGSTDDLTKVAQAAAAWHEGVSLAAPASVAPFLEVSSLAAVHERGPKYAVAEKWRRYLEPDPYEDLDMIRAAHAQPRLRALFPFTSHGSLLFSRCTGFPFSRDISIIHPLGRRLRVSRRGTPESRPSRAPGGPDAGPDSGTECSCRFLVALRQRRTQR